MPQQKKRYMTAEQYVREYMKAYKLGLSPVDLANRLGMRATSVYARSNILRKKGVKLPKLTGSTKRTHIDVKALNEFIKKGDY
jgi:hypothetical protein